MHTSIHSYIQIDTLGDDHKKETNQSRYCEGGLGGWKEGWGMVLFLQVQQLVSILFKKLLKHKANTHTCTCTHTHTCYGITYLSNYHPQCVCSCSCSVKRLSPGSQEYLLLLSCLYSPVLILFKIKKRVRQNKTSFHHPWKPICCSHVVHTQDCTESLTDERKELYC